MTTDGWRMSSSDTSMPAPRQSPVMKIVAAVAAAAVLALGASAVARHGSSPSGGQGAPQGRPGMFSPVTGATPAKLESAVAARDFGGGPPAGQAPGGQAAPGGTPSGTQS